MRSRCTPDRIAGSNYIAPYATLKLMQFMERVSRLPRIKQQFVIQMLVGVLTSASR